MLNCRSVTLGNPHRDNAEQGSVHRIFEILKFLPGVKRLCGIGRRLRCLLCHVGVFFQATMRNSKNHVLGTKNHTGKA